MQKEYLYKAPNHTANLNEMRLKDKWCDVTIKVNQKEIRAHKVILAANLKYFDAMFSNDSFQESKGIIIMEAVKETQLEEFVSYAYTGEILLTDSNAFNLLELANYLGEDGIKKACIDFLEKHLRKEEACLVYQFADTIDSPTLKNAARASIINNIVDCSKSSDYLNFDSESLTGVLSDGKSHRAPSQKLIFEAIMRWILHDVKGREIFMKDLLSCIDITTLKSDYLMEHIHENITNIKDAHCLIPDIISYYQTRKIEQNKQGQAVILVNTVNDKGSFQFYDFTKKKWSLLQGIADVAIDFQSCSVAVLNDKLYCPRRGDKVNRLNVFDPVTKQNKTLYPSSSIPGRAAVCACSKFLYFCGGINQDYSNTNKFLRYDLETNFLLTLTPMSAERYWATAIWYQGFLYVLGGGVGSFPCDSVEKYDPGTQKWTTLSAMCEGRIFHAAAVLDGKLYVCGGFEDLAKNSAEVYDPAKNSWQQVARMNQKRSSFVVIAYEGKLLAFGGDAEKTVEMYDPVENQWHMNHEMSSELQIRRPAGGLISASCLPDEK